MSLNCVIHQSCGWREIDDEGVLIRQIVWVARRCLSKDLRSSETSSALEVEKIKTRAKDFLTHTNGQSTSADCFQFLGCLHFICLTYLLINCQTHKRKCL